MKVKIKTLIITFLLGFTLGGMVALSVCSYWAETERDALHGRVK